jgi:endonuclease/exonuclease/phosphatase family metal-dependent hydrolase
MKNFRWLGIFLILMIFFSNLSSTQSRPTVKIASFNILRLGQDGWDKKKDWDKIVTILSEFDIIVLLEVMKIEKLDWLIKKLEEKENKNWVYTTSVSLGLSSSYREYYGIIWRDDDVDMLSKGIEGLFPDNTDDLAREPYFASFKAGKFDFTLICMHSDFGGGAQRREAVYMDNIFSYVQQLSDKEDDILLAGDFNLKCSHDAFAELRAIQDVFPIFSDTVKTTIGRIYKRSAAYDNIWIDSTKTTEFTGEFGVYNFDDIFYSHITDGFKFARDSISDHLPIWAKFYTDVDDDN